MNNTVFNFSIVISVLIATLFLPGPQASYSATIDPSFKFSTIETEHFVIHFHQGLDGIARKTAVLSEEMHIKLSSTLQGSTNEKNSNCFA